ncbi:MAG: PepSY domain-containing protein [Acidobacteriota bacterium]
MNRQRLQKFSRKVHRAFAPLIGIQLFLWTLGGLYFSWVHLDNVHGDYERAETVVADLLGATGMVSVESLLERSTLGRVEDVRVGTMMDRTVIRLYRDMDRVETYDAFSGELLSPISEAEAREIADDDFTPEAEIVAVQLVEEKGGEYKNAVPAYRVDFGNWKSTHVYVHANTGLVTSRRNSIWRGFDFLWMLHIVDFQNRENFNNWLLRILSVFGMATVLSGYLLWILTTPLFRRGRRSKSVPSSTPVSGT